MVIEDNELLLKTIEFRLKKEGHLITTAKDGREAMDELNCTVPDLIVTDIMMPFYNGLEIIGFVRSKLELKTPIIVLSTVGLEKTVLEAFELGADDFITKPFSPDELSMRVSRLLARVHSF